MRKEGLCYLAPGQKAAKTKNVNGKLIAKVENVTLKTFLLCVK